MHSNDLQDLSVTIEVQRMNLDRNGKLMTRVTQCLGVSQCIIYADNLANDQPLLTLWFKALDTIQQDVSTHKSCDNSAI